MGSNLTLTLNWDYAFDSIRLHFLTIASAGQVGNRTQAARDGDPEVYTANNLNQYTERTLSGQVHLGGTAAEDATVTVNRPSISGITVEPVTRQGSSFHKKLVLDNSIRADVEEIAVVGVLAGAHSTSSGQVDIVSTYSGVLWAAQSPERFTYDDDGNMLADALRKYEWDAENRLIAVTSSNVVDGSLTRVEFSYDYMSRRVSKKVYSWNSDSWLLTSGSLFLYDGWNLVKEVCAATGKGTITDYYIWGLDLSGSLGGAGGIGGLIGRVRSDNRYYDEQGMLLICHSPPGNPENRQTIRINENAWAAHEAHGDTLGACDGSSVSNSAFLYTFDGNGNVSELLGITSSNVTVAAHYEYSPFGETIVATGPEAQDNVFRFSTKYWDDETGLYYYGYRYYLPSLGRWLSRDPMGAWLNWDVVKITQLNNLYAFVFNNSVGNIDFLGLNQIKDVSYVIRPLGRHGTIEAYPPFGTYVDQVQAPDREGGSSASKSWGSVGYFYGAQAQSVVAGVVGSTDYSARPKRSTSLSFSAFVLGDVKVSACCSSKTIIVDWIVDVEATPVLDMKIGGKIHNNVDVFRQSDDGSFDLSLDNKGEASFYLEAYATWQHTTVAPQYHYGHSIVSVSVSCRPPRPD